MITLSDILLPEDILLDLEVGSAAALFDEVGQNMQRWHGLPRVQVAAALAALVRRRTLAEMAEAAGRMRRVRHAALGDSTLRSDTQACPEGPK
ncbi:MAG: hypothetical protein J0L85_07130 [Zoogloea sp.]|nr:hypothetical protein [Zoogloea sp.]MCA0186773.1 hypothetical protein [Pseudomonadota bacterium]